MQKRQVFIAIGANLGERRKNIAQAIGLLQKNPFITVDKISSLIETDPVGTSQAQPKYFNGVLEITTSLSAVKLLNYCQEIEKKIGRKPAKRNSPRPIDLDILLFGQEVIKTKNLLVPHPRMFTRYFVLKPLLEISPHILDDHPLVRPFKQQILNIVYSK